MSSNYLPVLPRPTLCKRRRVGRQVCIFRPRPGPGTALGFNKIPMSIFATPSEGWAHTAPNTPSLSLQLKSPSLRTSSPLGDSIRSPETAQNKIRSEKGSKELKKVLV